MSQHIVVDVEMNDEEAILEALGNMGYSPVVHEKPVSINFYNNKDIKANIVVSKTQCGFRYGDLGFEKTANGYKMHIDDIDQRSFNMSKLKQGYSEAKIKKSIKGKSKFMIKNRQEVDGKIKITIRVR